MNGSRIYLVFEEDYEVPKLTNYTFFLLLRTLKFHSLKNQLVDA